MRGKAMTKICDILSREKNIDLSQMKALEIFARDGSWQTLSYANKVSHIDAWEIDPSFQNSLKKNLPKATIKITDSIQEITKRVNFEKYDFIVIDNGQNCYGENRQFCEHFDVIPQIASLLKKKGIIIFNINRKPFGYSHFPDWKVRREAYYQRKRTDNISIEWLLPFYKKLFRKFGYATKFSFSISRKDYEHDDYLYYLVYYIKKTND